MQLALYIQCKLCIYYTASLLSVCDDIIIIAFMVIPLLICLWSMWTLLLAVNDLGSKVMCASMTTDVLNA